jgi:hypothetical protein
VATVARGLAAVDLAEEETAEIDRLRVRLGRVVAEIRRSFVLPPLIGETN